MTLIGWIAAVVMNNPKDEFASFHIRQMLGLMVFSISLAVASFVLIFIPLLGVILAFLGFAMQLGLLGLFVFSFIGAIKGEQWELPVIGDKFQEWFRTL